MKVKIIHFLLFIFNLFRPNLCGFINVASEEKVFEISEEVENDEINENDRSQKKLFSGTLYKTVKRYRCFIDAFEDSFMLLYGTKTWNFPQQDVNLKLSYPEQRRHASDFRPFVITGVEVVLHMDGSESKGYITSGGMLQESINLSFIVSNITLLSYEFWLYGVPKVKAHGPEINTVSNLCT